MTELAKARTHNPPGGQPPPTLADVTHVGSGWAGVLIARLPEPVDAGAEGGPAGGPDLLTLLAGLPRVAGSWGSGRLLTSRLVSVLITDDRRILVGAVPPERLYQAAAEPPARPAR